MHSADVASPPVPDAIPFVREPLAVIGIGCRLPGGLNSPTALWNALLKGVDAIREVPEDRWKHSRFHDTDPEKFGCIRNAKGGFIDGVDQFDAEFFGYFPTEASRLDPQQRLLLEVTHEAMEDAGLRRDQLDGSRTAVFVGSFMYDYLIIQSASESRDEINPYVAMGTAVSSLANRISFDFNLTGPSVALDTACSSSLVAVHMACSSLWAREADLAIAAGVNVLLRPETSIALSKGGFLNPDQHCKAFDASANGYVRSEGVGVVFLKPLRKALLDGDSIYAVVRGSGVNQDGYMREGLTVPNVISQIALLEAVYGGTGIDPQTVDYVEAHGTGTAVGDPIESLALGAILGQDRDPGRRCWLGSVKTNLGHLEGAAGITGFIKGALTAHHGIVPPNLHFHEPNPGIAFDSMNLEVPTRPAPLEPVGRPWTVGVNSFGAGGTNAHVVLQGLDHRPARKRFAAARPADALPATLYMLSAAHPDARKAVALRHAEFLSTTREHLEDLAFSAFSRRSHYPHLLAVVGRTPKEVADQLRRFAEGQLDRTTLATRVNRKKEPKVAFVFSGQGGQWAGMGLQLMRREPVFREAIEEVDSLFQELAGWSLLDELRKGENVSRIDDTTVVQPAVMAIQIALVALYEHYGVRPRGVVGHSIGEVAAAFASGAISLEDAVRVIYHRSQAQDRAPGRGGMLAVGLSAADAGKAIGRYEGRVSVAAVNGPKMVTLSGDEEPLRRIAEALEARGVFNRAVRVRVAYHSHQMEPIRDDLLAALDGESGHVATTPLYSTVTGRREVGTHLTAAYWYENVRRPVLFTDALAAMLNDGYDTFVEVGPHPVLVGGAEALFQAREVDALICPAMTRRDPEEVIFLQSLARLTARGAESDAAALFGPGRRYVRMPNYPWQHARYWFEAPAAAELRRGRFEHPYLKRQTEAATEPGLAVWEASVDVHRSPYLRDHQVDGEVVFPATGHLELAWAVASEQFRHGPFFLENLHFDTPLIVPTTAPHPLDVRLEIVSGEGDYRICSRAAGAPRETPWSRHSSGRINTAHDRFDEPGTTLDDLRQQFHEAEEVDVGRFYEALRVAGMEYGDRFRGIQQMWRGGGELLARLELPNELAREAQRVTVHPALLDAAAHVIFAGSLSDGEPVRVYLPYRIDRVRFHRQPTRAVWSYVRVTRADEQYLCSDTLVFDDSGALVAELIGLTCKRLAGTGARGADAAYEGCYEPRWVSAPRDLDLHGRVHDTTTAVLFADAGDVCAALAERLAAEGIRTLILQPGPRDSVGDLLADVPLDRRCLIVFAAGLSPASEGRAWNGLDQCPAVPQLLHLAQTLLQREGVPRLVVVTNGAGGVDGDRDLDLGQATLHGMSRVIRNECPNVPVQVIDVAESVGPRELDSLVHELLHVRRDRDETEIALRGPDRSIRQLAPVDRDAAEQAAATTEPGVGGSYRADVMEPGALDQIVFRRLDPRDPGPGEVEIAVEAAALNFKDVMNAMGLLPEHAVAGGLTAHRLGLEVAGRVLRTGPGVRDVAPGDAVVARVPEGFCGRVVTPANCVVRRPESLTPQQAAAIPHVTTTAWYALHHLARLAPGETVLIHSAAGGVGTAAIQLARRAGATVIATAGTQEKREYVRRMGVEHVFDSRSLDFSNKVLEATGGRGVDVVLNSLAGRFIAQSLKCLAPFGRFIELGKADIYRNGKLGLERLGENVTYSVVDMDRLAAARPDLHRRILTEVVALFERGELRPPEVTAFPVSKLPEALKFMTRAAYTGKIVLDMAGDRVSARPPRAVTFRPDRTYLVSGGASGLGLEVARWAFGRGARHLVLFSRSGCKSVADGAAVNAMRAGGAEVVMARGDVSDSAAVEQLVRRIAAEMPPLAGVIHGAAVMDDATIPSTDMARVERVFAPKAQGAWNLHAATLAAGADLDFFVMFSSISSALGFYGQLNYAASNYFQDALARYRQQRGLTASAVNLGVLGQYAGLSRAVNEKQDVIGLLQSHGLLVMSLGDALAKLEAVLVQRPVERVTGRFDWAKYRAAYPHLARDARLMEVMSDAALAGGAKAGGNRLRATLAAAPPAERAPRLVEELRAVLARVLGVGPEQLDPAASIDGLGLDSLMLTQLRNWALRSLDVNLPLIKLLKGPSLEVLAADLLAALDHASNPGAGAKGTDDRPAFALTDLDGIQTVSPWLIRGRGRADAPARLVCFHSMGVGASLFTAFLLNPPTDCDVLAVQTPGRENRQAEPVVANVDQLADLIAPQIAPLFDRPVVVWGHSFGGIVAWEVLRRLRDRHDLAPVHLVISGTVAPHLIPLWQKREVMLKAMVADNDPEYLVSLSRYVDDVEFLKALIPGLRRDYPLLTSCRARPVAPQPVPITAFAARQDDMVYTDEVREWGRHTTGGFELVEVDGDHWFLNRNRALITEALRGIAAGPGDALVGSIALPVNGQASDNGAG